MRVETACAFTGHRPKSFPWKYNETDPRCLALKDILAEQIVKLAQAGVTDYYSGMALGSDLWCSRIVLNLRQNNPALNLHCILPCEEQECKWSPSAQEQYRTILSQADEVVYVRRTYSSDCMLERNRYMVDRAGILLAVYTGAYRSGTGMTVRYANKMGRKTIIIDPKTGIIRPSQVINI